MADKQRFIPLSDILPAQNNKNAASKHIDIIIREEIPVYCENLHAKKSRLMPFKTLYDNNKTFWNQKSNWKFYLTKDGLEKLNEKAAAENVEFKFEIQNTNAGETKAEKGYGSEYETFTSMSAGAKVEHLNKKKEKLEKLKEDKNRKKDKVIETLVDSVKDAALINRAVLEEAVRLGDDEAKKLTQDLVDSTKEMVKTSTSLITEDIFSNELMNTLVQKSNGTIVQHMTRVYLNGIAFLVYFNNLVSSSSIIQKTRISFNSKYRDYYHTLLPHLHIDDLTVERVFLNSMQAIPPALLQNWAVGFLIHDVGKAAAVEYHEGEDKYDRSIVIEHVKLGYKYAMTKTNYPMEANLIIGYHHEYYGDPAGYGYFRAYLQQYKKLNPGARQNYCITYEKEPVLDYQALAYFPTKILEIIDIFDSVTDPNRVYRKAMKADEALVMMREEFVEKHHKIDPILFDIFTDFAREKYALDRQTALPKDNEYLTDEKRIALELEQKASFLQELLRKSATEES